MPTKTKNSIKQKRYRYRQKLALLMYQQLIELMLEGEQNVRKKTK